jgi:hypothetical protein
MEITSKKEVPTLLNCKANCECCRIENTTVFLAATSGSDVYYEKVADHLSLTNGSYSARCGNCVRVSARTGEAASVCETGQPLFIGTFLDQATVRGETWLKFEICQYSASSGCPT